MRNYLRATTSILFGIAIFLFWLLGYPEAMNYQEQNQLFLTTTDYFFQSMAVPGGMADYISEFIVQLYYLPWLGAMATGVIYALMQWTMWMVVRRWNKGLYLLTFLLPIVMLWHQGDIDTLLSLPVAIIITLSAAAFMPTASAIGIKILDIILVPILFWLAGPAAWIYAIVRGISNGWHWLTANASVMVLSTFAAYWAVDYQWPLAMVAGGINYYRIPMHAPTMQYVVILTPVAIALAARFSPWKNEDTCKGQRRYLRWAMQVSALAIAGIFAKTMGFTPAIYDMLWNDYMVRQERWNDIIDHARDRQPDNAFLCNCLNLALGMTNQLADRMFVFNQTGSDALLLPSVRDNMSNLPTAEAFWRLGMVNSAKRYMMDIQMSILNARSSGRCAKRIAECYIVNGDYKTAAKYLELLKHTLFYSSWAKDAETYLGDEARIKNHPLWGKMRSYRYKERMLYNYAEKHKMLGLLFMNNTDNRLALSYFMGQLLLDGEFQMFMGYMSWVQQYGGYTSMPYGYADACQAIQQQGNVPGSAYASYVRKKMEKMKHEDN